jgi:hypothetical protein
MRRRPRRRSGDRRPRTNPAYARFTHRKLARRIARPHQNGLAYRSVKASERRRKLSYFLFEMGCVNRRSWRLKNNIRKKIGKAPLSRITAWYRTQRDYGNTVSADKTRAQLKAAGVWMKASDFTNAPSSNE